MPSYTLVSDSQTPSLTTGGLTDSAAITLARLVCDTTIGTDDLNSTNSQNNFVIDLIAAVGPVIAFNSICRQLLKIKNTVQYAYVGTSYSDISANTYSNYLSSYLLKDTALAGATVFPQTVNFLPEQFQTLAAFANAGIVLSDLLQVVDYHILMLYLTGLTATDVNSLIYTNLANPYSSTYSYSKYTANDNIALAKYFYAISTIAQNGNVVFTNAMNTPPSHIVVAALKDPSYLADDDKIFGLIASISTVVGSNNTIRNAYTYLTKPVNYSLSGNDLTRSADGTSSYFTINRMTTYATLNTTKNMYYWKLVNNGIGVAGSLEPGTRFNPNTKQLVTVAALSTQSVQSIYTTLSMSSSNSTPIDNNAARDEISQLKNYGKTILEIRGLVDSNNFSIPAFNNPQLFVDAGFSKKDVSASFSGLVSGTNYDFAVLIKICKYVSDSTLTNASRMKVVAETSGNYDFSNINTESIASSAIVSKLKTIISFTDSVYDFSTAGNPKNLLDNIKACYNDFTTTTVINSGNAELAVLRFLHSSAAMNATWTEGSGFTASYSLPNLYYFSKLSNTLSAASSTITPTQFLTPLEFGSYKAGSLLDSNSFVDTSNNYLKGPVPSASVPVSSQYWTTLPTDPAVILVKQYYTLGYFAKSYYQGSVSTGTYFDNGYNFGNVYNNMTPNTPGASKIDGIRAASWPKEIVFTNYSLLLNDAVVDIKKKMNPNNVSNISDLVLLSQYSSTDMWCTLTDLLKGKVLANKYDNTSYKALLNAGATAQYIKVDLAKNIPVNITASDFGGFGLPIEVALYVANNSTVSGHPTIKTIAQNSAYSRYARRSIFTNVVEAALQLDADTFIELVWSPSQLTAVMNGSTPLNLSIVDLLTLDVNSNEITSDYFVVPNQQKRLAYHTDAVRKDIVRAFYPSLSAELTAQLAALYDTDEILDFLSNNNL